MLLFSRLMRYLGTQQRKLEERPAERLYQSILKASRQPNLYTEFEVHDHLDSRFDMLCLHISLLMGRLRMLPEDVHKPLNQELFDRFFADMDFTLREMGVGDLGVGKRVRKMSEAFMGRLLAYTKSLERNDKTELALVLARNIRRSHYCNDADRRMADYVLESRDRLSAVSDNEMQAGTVDLVAILALHGDSHG
ncbi:MAG: ubiquinol-cytochrome c chaperone [Alphaproteobacteria bacterium]|nr:MAG: ubiquinol-cytochrome c chaperone [Alphaproteobacteria bacterium]